MFYEGILHETLKSLCEGQTKLYLGIHCCFKHFISDSTFPSKGKYFITVFHYIYHFNFMVNSKTKVSPKSNLYSQPSPSFGVQGTGVGVVVENSNRVDSDK